MRLLICVMLVTWGCQSSTDRKKNVKSELKSSPSTYPQTITLNSKEERWKSLTLDPGTYRIDQGFHFAWKPWNASPSCLDNNGCDQNEARPIQDQPLRCTQNPPGRWCPEKWKGWKNVYHIKDTNGIIQEIFYGTSKIVTSDSIYRIGDLPKVYPTKMDAKKNYKPTFITINAKGEVEFTISDSNRRDNSGTLELYISKNDIISIDAKAHGINVYFEEGQYEISVENGSGWRAWNWSKHDPNKCQVAAGCSQGNPTKNKGYLHHFFLVDSGSIIESVVGFDGTPVEKAQVYRFGDKPEDPKEGDNKVYPTTGDAMKFYTDEEIGNMGTMSIKVTHAGYLWFTLNDFSFRDNNGKIILKFNKVEDEPDDTTTDSGTDTGNNSNEDACQVGSIDRSSEMNEFLSRHNKARSDTNNSDPSSEQHPRPSPGLECLTWNTELADIASAYAEYWYTYHSDTVTHSFQTDFWQNNYPEIENPQSKYGENISYGSNKSIDDAMSNWFTSEKSSYDYRTNTCSRQNPYESCGHYLQIVSSKATHIGCAREKSAFGSSDLFYMVCLFSPAGRGGDDNRPYKIEEN